MGRCVWNSASADADKGVGGKLAEVEAVAVAAVAVVKSFCLMLGLDLKKRFKTSDLPDMRGSPTQTILHFGLLSIIFASFHRGGGGGKSEEGRRRMLRNRNCVAVAK